MFVGDAWGVHVGPEIPVPDRAAEPKAVQAMADAFAGFVARHPEDWHMLQPVGAG